MCRLVLLVIGFLGTWVYHVDGTCPWQQSQVESRDPPRVRLGTAQGALKAEHTRKEL